MDNQIQVTLRESSPMGRAAVTMAPDRSANQRKRLRFHEIAPVNVLAASAYLESTTVNIAEYTGMNNGVRAALELGADNLVVVGDSRLAIQQSLGVIACRKETLMAQLNYHKELTSKLK
ncbi:hypothetical protein PHMEG_00041389 [Phytophthora megakarya]|uniref:RNase H type-1 domain-containing protein n=1 Tax=Phytophthora megakarya TaxID=4795 RepID=A0A225UED0_9STRA|nr:hypothetical protein PHMEG_00041389 [Phytophthora megakarya]